MTLRELWERAEPTVGTFLDQILAVPGVDGVYVGPNDLADIHCAGPETAIRWREAGFRMLNIDNDSVFLRAGAARVLEALRGMKREVAKTGY